MDGWTDGQTDGWKISIFRDKLLLLGEHVYCIMRECENILHGYLYGGDLSFVILKRIYGFKFRKRFLEIFSRDLSSFLLQLT
jgi:hypothetical protein